MHGARLHKTSRRDAMARDETYCAEAETYCSEAETRRNGLAYIPISTVRDVKNLSLELVYCGDSVLAFSLVFCLFFMCI